MTCTWVACKVASPIKVKAMYCMCHDSQYTCGTLGDTDRATWNYTFVTNSHH
jgi:hypothetical protein